MGRRCIPVANLGMEKMDGIRKDWSVKMWRRASGEDKWQNSMLAPFWTGRLEYWNVLSLAVSQQFLLCLV
jgi:hypothetical protein